AGELLGDEPVRQLARDVLHHRAEQAGLVTEVVVQRTAGEPGAGDYVLGPGTRVALLREQVAGRAHQGGPGVVNVLGPPRDNRRHASSMQHTHCMLEAHCMLSVVSDGTPGGPGRGGELSMAVPLRQNLRIGAYLARQRLARREKFPLVVELEPLFACNLACPGCGKIPEPAHILKQRMSVQTAIAAVEECGAPMVSIAGGEPLIHPEAHLIAAELVARRKFVYFCTNALLMRKKMDNFTPSPYFAWAVHMDG